MNKEFINWLVGLIATTLISVAGWFVFNLFPIPYISLLESWGITMIAMSAAAGVASYDNKTEI